MDGGSGDLRAGAKRFPPRCLHKQYSTGFQGRFWEFLVPDGLFKKKKKITNLPNLPFNRQGDGWSGREFHDQKTQSGNSRWSGEARMDRG